MIRRRVGRVAVLVFQDWKLPLPWPPTGFLPDGSWMYSTPAVGSNVQALDEVVARASGPIVSNWIGQESNLRNHVLRTGSRVCLQKTRKDRRSFGQRFTCSTAELQPPCRK